jgi:hypothetical protein
MKIHTMAMQISESNWSVAAAILGSEVSGTPVADVYGSYVVINTFEDGHVYRSPGIRRHSQFGDLTLRNILLSAEDFNHMFDYDKRTKNLEHFFQVTQINKRALKVHPDQELDQAISTLNEVWHRED